MIIYHITTQQDWQKAQAVGVYTAESLVGQGFIHASTGEQVTDTAQRYYSGWHGLLLLAIETSRVRPEVRFELVMLPIGETQFPHIYGPLNLDAVTGIAAFEPDAQGVFNLPDNFHSPEQ